MITFRMNGRCRGVNIISCSVTQTRNSLTAAPSIFEMKKNQTLYIEKCGDLAVKAEDEGGSLSVECKHYSDKIHLLHHNVINTLYNWAQPNFHQEQYEKLFLITTQEIRDNDDLRVVVNKNSEDLYQIITNAFKAEIKRINEKVEGEKKSNPNAKLAHVDFSVAPSDQPQQHIGSISLGQRDKS